MLKIITLVCVLVAVLTAVLSEAWLLSRRGHGETVGRIYGILRGRNRSFIIYQYPSILIGTVIISAAIGLGINWRSAAVYFLGAALCCAADLIGSAGYVSGGTASANAGLNGDVRNALKGAFRSGEVLGACATSIGLVALGALFMLLEAETAVSLAACLALGASSAAVLLNVGGRAYSSAYSMASSSKDFNDTAGNFAGTGAELFESYIASAAAVMLLAQSASDMSGFNSVVIMSDAAKFPLIIYASGIVASLIGCLFFNVRSLIRPDRGMTVSCIIAGVIEIAASLYFSNRFFSTVQYGLAIATGIVAGLALGEISKLFAGDNRIFIRNLKSDRKLGSQAPAIFNMGTGMVSVFFYAALIILAMIIANNIALTYGITLCAVGLISIALSFASISGLSIVSGTASGIVQTMGDEADRDVISDSLEMTSIRSEMPAKTYLLTSSAFAAAAVFFAFMNGIGLSSIDMMQPFTIAGVLGGVAVPFILMGMILYSVRLTGKVALRSFDRSDDDGGMVGSLRGSLTPAVLAIFFPSAVGLLFGVEILTGFLCTSAFTGIMIAAVYNDSGQYYRNSASQSLCSLIKLMIIFSIVFTPVFISVGGFLFQ